MIIHKPDLIRVFAICLAVLGFSTVSMGQEEEVRFLVERIKVVDQNKPIYNIYVDEDNNKWIGNSEAVFFVEAKDRADKIEIPPGQQSLLQLPGGDADIRWSKQEIREILGDAKITTAAYNKRDQMLWIGTDGYGVFKIRVNDSGLRLIEEIYIDNSKLRSDFINLIYITPEGKVWIATEDGAMLIKDGSSSIYQKFFNIQTISGNRRQTWATGDGLVWIIDKRDNWEPIEINKREIEGEMHDIAFDQEGRIWIASNIMTSFIVESQRYQHFGPGQYFTSQFVNYVSVDDDGTIWVGSDDKGVYIIEKASTITVTSNLDKGLSCEGGVADAKVSLRAIGGQPPYQFAWSDGGTGEVRSDLGAGVYNITVTDSQGSSKSEDVEIMDPAITVNVREEEPESDEGMADGIAVLDAKGGVPGYNAIWSTGAKGARLTGVSEGTYAVTVTDQAGCTATGEVVVTRRVAELTAAIEVTSDNPCIGDGSNLIVNISGGKEPFTYNWPGIEASEPEVRGLTPGSYSVSVTDALGTVATASIVIEEPEEFSANIEVVSSASTGGTDGRARIVVEGGQEPFTYAWSNGEGAAEANALGAMEHTITVTDNNGCTATSSVVITENILPLEVSILQQEDILCAGDLTAAISAEVGGGKGPYSFQWSNGAEGEELTGIGAGSYQVTVTDALGTSAVFESEVIQPEPMLINSKVVQPATANNADGIAQIDVTGGAGNYSYNWEVDATGAQAEGLRAGSYTVTVTDASGCRGTVTIAITEDILPLNLSIEQRGDILCNGEATGGLVADITGGKSPYTYQWNDGVQTQVRQDLTAGLYAVTVTDVTGSTSVFESELTEPEAIVVNVSVEASATANNSDGIAVARASGGVEDYTYQWANGSTDGRATGLPPGEHVVTVTDANACSATGVVTITEDILPLAVEITQTNTIECHGSSTASAEVQVSGGKSPFTYSWGSSNSGWASDANGAIVEGVPAGVLSVTVTDVEGSEVSYQTEITEPTKVVANAIAVAPASTGNSDGSAKVNGTGGTENYTPLWDNNEVTQTATQLSPGLHSVTITDDAGCTAVAEVTITENILPLDAAVVANSGILCKGGTTGELAVEVTGGKAPFAYTWSNGEQGETVSGLGVGSYDVTIADAVGTEIVRNYSLIEPSMLGANISVVSVASTNSADGVIEAIPTGGTEPYTYAWGTGATEGRLEGVAAGEYAVTVTDANGCTATVTSQLSENILPLTVDIERDNSLNLCFGDEKGIATVVPVGGKPPYDYAWDDGSTETERVNLGEGSYSVSVTDVLGSSATAMVMYNTPDELVATIADAAPANTGESDGSARVEITGGTTPYTIAWSVGQSQALVNTLPAGIHTVSVTDANGCISTAEIEITEDVLPLSITIVRNAEVSCAGDSDASAKLSISGGKGPFNISWSNGAAGEEISGLGAGDYSVTVTDAIEQVSSGEFSVEEPSALSGELNDVRAAAAEHVPDGRATVSMDGGAGGYTYNWDSGETTQTAKELSIGMHSVTVSDANGCSTVLSTEITKKIIPELTAETLQSGDPVRMEQLQFEADSTSITAESMPTLNELYQFLYDNPTIVVEIGGHTNGLPEHDYCDSLSTLRAKEVAVWLVNQGIDERRVYYKGYGKRRPIATNQTREGRARNQRVEVRILRLDGDN